MEDVYLPKVYQAQAHKLMLEMIASKHEIERMIIETIEQQGKLFEVTLCGKLYVFDGVFTAQEHVARRKLIKRFARKLISVAFRHEVPELLSYLMSGPDPRIFEMEADETAAYDAQRVDSDGNKITSIALDEDSAYVRMNLGLSPIINQESPSEEAI